MSLHTKLLYLFPDANAGNPPGEYNDWLAYADKNNEWIEEWNLSDPQPTQEELDAISDEEAQTALEQRKPVTYTADEFFLLFTKDEHKAIKQASRTDGEIEYALDRLNTVRTVNAESEETQGYLNYLVSLGLITQEKADSIVAGRHD